MKPPERGAQLDVADKAGPETTRRGWKHVLKAYVCSVAAVTGSVCFAFSIYWFFASGHAFRSCAGPLNAVGENLQIVSSINLVLSLVVLLFDKERGLVGAIGSAFGLLVTMTAMHMVA